MLHPTQCCAFLNPYIFIGSQERLRRENCYWKIKKCVFIARNVYFTIKSTLNIQHIYLCSTYMFGFHFKSNFHFIVLNQSKQSPIVPVFFRQWLWQHSQYSENNVSIVFLLGIQGLIKTHKWMNELILKQRPLGTQDNSSISPTHSHCLSIIM